MADVTVVRGGTIVDGTGAPGVAGDVAIADGKIVGIGSGLSGDHSIDATGASSRQGSSTSTPTTTPRCSGTRR
jgi:N-acyl-D-aspartate/D-glutamate deacylase